MEYYYLPEWIQKWLSGKEDEDLQMSLKQLEYRPREVSSLRSYEVEPYPPPSTKFGVYIDSLDDNITDEQIRGHFPGCLMKVKRLNTGDGFVHFKTKRDAEKAIQQLQYSRLGRYQIELSHQRSNNELRFRLFIIQKNYMQDKKEVHRFFEERLGRRVKIVHYRSPAHPASGSYVEFYDEESRNLAHMISKDEFEGQTFSIRRQ